MAFEVNVVHYPYSSSDPARQHICATYSDVMSIIPEYLINEIVSRIADRFIEEHYSEIAKEISPTVIAAVASATAGAKIMKEMQMEVDRVNATAQEALRKAKRR